MYAQVSPQIGQMMLANDLKCNCKQNDVVIYTKRFKNRKFLGFFSVVENVVYMSHTETFHSDSTKKLLASLYRQLCKHTVSFVVERYLMM